MPRKASRKIILRVKEEVTPKQLAEMIYGAAEDVIGTEDYVKDVIKELEKKIS